MCSISCTHVKFWFSVEVEDLLLYFYPNVSTNKIVFFLYRIKTDFLSFLKKLSGNLKDAIFLSDFDTTVTLVSNGMAIYPWTNSIRVGDQSWCNAHREIICIVLSLKIIYYDGCNPFYNVRLIFVKEKKEKENQLLFYTVPLSISNCYENIVKTYNYC